MHPLTKLLGGFPAIGVAAAAGLAVMAPSAQAITVPCELTSYPGNLVFGTSFACKVGDKTYSNFVDNTSGSILSTRAYDLKILNQDEFYTASVIGDFRPSIASGNYSYSYRVTVDPDSPYYIQSYSTGATTAAFGTIWNKQLFTNPAGSPNPAFTSNPVATSPDSVFATPGTKVVDFTSTFFIGTRSATQLTDGITQARLPGTEVPGPLPILGAAAAFGYSRKIRRRIRVVV
jgi:hypothetical protein